MLFKRFRAVILGYDDISSEEEYMTSRVEEGRTGRRTDEPAGNN
jgi:hypothetical protein